MFIMEDRSFNRGFPFSVRCSIVTCIMLTFC